MRQLRMLPGSAATVSFPILFLSRNPSSGRSTIRHVDVDLDLDVDLDYLMRDILLQMLHLSDRRSFCRVWVHDQVQVQVHDG